MFPIRVTHCIAGLSRGGYETLLYNLLRAIDRSVIQFDFIYSFDGVYTDVFDAMGCRLFKVPFITKRGPFSYASALRNIFLSNTENVIVHSHMDKFSGMVLREAARCAVPVRIAHSHSTKNSGGFLYSAVKNHYGKLIDKYATDFLACGKSAAEWLFGDRADRALIVRNAIDIDRYRVETDAKHPFTVCSVARFEKVKNHSFLLDVFASLRAAIPESRLVLAGNGRLIPEMKSKAVSLGIADSVEFLGDCDDIPALFSRCDVFCLPSLYEGIPLSLIEAEAAGLYCVVSDNISMESDAGQTVFLPLSLGSGHWASVIASAFGRSKCSGADALRTDGFDINDAAAKLQDYYVKRYEEETQTG